MIVMKVPLLPRSSVLLEIAVAEENQLAVGLRLARLRCRYSENLLKQNLDRLVVVRELIIYWIC